MLSSCTPYNYSALLSTLYFANYSVTFILFFLTIHNLLNSNNNIYSISFLLKYSKQRLSTFILAFVSLLGIPPLNLFAPKFAASANAWVFGGGFFFVFVMLSIFLSFALYLQVFDILFKHKLAVVHFVKSAVGFNSSALDNGESGSAAALNNLGAFCLFGFLVFKDTFVLLGVFL